MMNETYDCAYSTPNELVFVKGTGFSPYIKDCTELGL
jgi:hypothetical protein